MKPQSLQLIEAKDRHVKIGWQEPKISGNAKVSFYRLTSYCEQTNRHMVQSNLFNPNHFFEKFCSDNRNSGLLKVFNIRLGLEFFSPMSGLSRIPD